LPEAGLPTNAESCFGSSVVRLVTSSH
jgi:hypothetical protein